MKFNFLLLALSLSLWSNAQQFLNPEPIKSEFLNEDRPYMVYLPHSYNNETFVQRKYPVVVLLDGHAHHWYTMQTMAFLSRMKIIPECILVTIHNTDRTRDLTPTHSTTMYDGEEGVEFLKNSGGGENFLNFIYRELLPTVDSTYNTMDLKIFIGHSFGGLTTMQSFLSNESPFDAFISMDPSVWWDDNLCLKQLDSAMTLSERKVWYMTGANNNFYREDTTNIRLTQMEFHKKLKKKFPDIRAGYKIYEDDNHNSVTFPSLYDGLRFIFKNYRITQETQEDFDLFINHFKQISEEWGVEFVPSEFIVNEIAYSLYGTDQFENAQKYFEYNVERYPNSFNAYDSLADFCAKTGRKKRAIKYYKKSLELNPNNKNAEMILKELK